MLLSTIVKINKMDNNNTDQGFQTDRDNNYKEDIMTDKYANVSKVKPLEFLNHVYKRFIKSVRRYDMLLFRLFFNVNRDCFCKHKLYFWKKILV